MAEAEPCIKYKSTFDSKDCGSYKLPFGDEATKESLPSYKRSFGIEGLIHCVGVYNERCDEYDVSVPRKFARFHRMFDEDTETKKEWFRIRDEIPVAQRNTNARFKRAIEDLIHALAPGDNPRDVLIAYMESDGCKKPYDATTHEHIARLKELREYTEKLRGTKPIIAAESDEFKTIVFKSFPNGWQEKYHEANQRLTDDDISDIQRYMDILKGIADKNKKRKRDDADRIRGGGDDNGDKNKKKKNKHENQPKTKPSDPCPHHNGHTWYLCKHNPEGPNYIGNQQQRFHGGGRGGGRGGYNGGRGFNGGRGGRGGNYGGRGNGYSYGNQHHSNTFNREFTGGRGSGGRGRGNGGRGHYNGNQGRGNGNQDHYYGNQDHYYQGQRFDENSGSSGGQGNDEGTDMYFAGQARWRQERDHSNSGTQFRRRW
jgi:hypothetical protein